VASRPVYGPGNGIQKNLSTPVLKKPEGGPPKAGDAVPQGGRVREGAARPRTGGSATPPRTRLALGAVGGKWALHLQRGGQLEPAGGRGAARGGGNLGSDSGFSTAVGVKAFFKLKTRARYGFWEPRRCWAAGVFGWVKVRLWSG